MAGVALPTLVPVPTPASVAPAPVAPAPGTSAPGFARAVGAAEARARLAALQAAGLIRHASAQTGGGLERSLPVSPALRALLPHGDLRRGSTIAVAPGCTSLVFALLAEAAAAGSWCVAVGMPQLGLVAAAETGVSLERFALVPSPGSEWASVVAALLDGMDLVVAAVPGRVSAQVSSRLSARARQRGGVLVPVGRWPGADLTLEAVGGAWHGLGQGRGRLRRREVEVLSHGRGAATRPRRARLWLPGAADVIASDDGQAAPTREIASSWTESQPVGERGIGARPPLERAS